AGALLADRPAAAAAGRCGCRRRHRWLLLGSLLRRCDGSGALFVALAATAPSAAAPAAPAATAGGFAFGGLLLLGSDGLLELGRGGSLLLLGRWRLLLTVAAGAGRALIAAVLLLLGLLRLRLAAA